MSETLADRLAAFALGRGSRTCPRTLWSRPGGGWWIHWAVPSGPSRSPRRRSRRVAGRFQGTPSVGLIGGGTSAPDWAAFANGVHIRYLDCNDTYLSLEPAHPSDNWAAVMAAGQLAGADGKAWIAAAAIAYEVQCRLCDAASIRARGWDHTTYGSISATLAAAKLLGLSHEQTVHALGIAGTTGTALRLTRAGELSMWKGCAFAFAARNGVFAALLAADGMTGPAPLFEGEMGFFQQVSGPFSLAQAGRTRRRRLDAAEDLDQVRAGRVPQPVGHRRGLRRCGPRSRTRRRIQSIEIATFRVAVEIIGKDPEKWRPKTRETADHSLPYCTAVALVDGEISAEQFSAERLADPALLDLVVANPVVEDPELTAGYPAGIPNRVTVTLDDGTKLVEEVAFPPGHDKNPLTDDQLADKFHGLVDPVLGRERPGRSGSGIRAWRTTRRPTRSCASGWSEVCSPAVDLRLTASRRSTT